MPDINVELENLTKEVSELETVVDSAVALINGIAEMIRTANIKNDPAMKALADRLDAKASGLAAAVEAHTTPP